ncbi:hypothetical protein [Streptomyces sp. NPDC057398]|uniref:hypothetical protein n=1 Tax=Streptomyces sp. NPDC057398 TaxID=3346118 RepID=UPI0036C15F52
MSRELKDGEEVRLRGSAGALFVTTVGQPFSKEAIERRLGTKEWTWPDEDAPEQAEPDGPRPRTEAKSKPDPDAESGPQPRTELLSEPGERDEPGPQPRTEIVSSPGGSEGRPPVNAPKSVWIDYVVSQGKASREDAANFTKADLIDMAE